MPHAAAGRQGARAAAPAAAPRGAPHGAVALKALDRTRLTPKAVQMLAQEVGIPRFPPTPHPRPHPKASPHPHQVGILRGLQHDHIVQLLGVSASSRWVFMVMQVACCCSCLYANPSAPTD